MDLWTTTFAEALHQRTPCVTTARTAKMAMEFTQIVLGMVIAGSNRRNPLKRGGSRRVVAPENPGAFLTDPRRCGRRGSAHWTLVARNIGIALRTQDVALARGTGRAKSVGTGRGPTEIAQWRRWKALGTACPLGRGTGVGHACRAQHMTLVWLADERESVSSGGRTAENAQPSPLGGLHHQGGPPRGSPNQQRCAGPARLLATSPSQCNILLAGLALVAQAGNEGQSAEPPIGLRLIFGAARWTTRKMAAPGRFIAPRT
jgi:hypothetical protein